MAGKFSVKKKKAPIVQQSVSPAQRRHMERLASGSPVVKMLVEKKKRKDERRALTKLEKKLGRLLGEPERPRLTTEQWRAKKAKDRAQRLARRVTRRNSK